MAANASLPMLNKLKSKASLPESLRESLILSYNQDKTSLRTQAWKVMYDGHMGRKADRLALFGPVNPVANTLFPKAGRLALNAPANPVENTFIPTWRYRRLR